MKIPGEYYALQSILSCLLKRDWTGLRLTWNFYWHPEDWKETQEDETST